MKAGKLAVGSGQLANFLVLRKKVLSAECRGKRKELAVGSGQSKIKQLANF